MPIPQTNLDMIPKQYVEGTPQKGGLDMLPVIKDDMPNLDPLAILRRSTVLSGGRLPYEVRQDNEDTIDTFNRMRKSIENTIKLGDEAILRQQDAAAAYRTMFDINVQFINDTSQPDEIRYGADIALAAHVQEQINKKDNLSSEKRYVEAMQGMLATGQYDQARMVSTLHSSPTAWDRAVRNQTRSLYLQKVIEDNEILEEDRFFLFNLIDMAMMTLPFVNSAANVGNVDTKDVRKGIGDYFLSGDRLQSEVYALNHIQNDDEFMKKADEWAKNIKNHTTYAGYRNQLRAEFLVDNFTRRTMSTNETNFWDTLDLVGGPFLAYDAVKGTRAAIGIPGMLKRAGLRRETADLIHKVMTRADEVGLAKAAEEAGVSLEELEKMLKPGALDPTANPLDTSIAGQVVADQRSIEDAAREIIGQHLELTRLSDEEAAGIIPAVKAQAKKDFGRHVHDVQVDEIKLVNGSTVRSPVVQLGTTKNSLFVTKEAAEEQMATLGLESAVVRPVVSENGVLYAIEARLPLTESAFYAAHTDTAPKNFLERFLYGSRQTSADSTYAMGELVTAKRQRIIKNIFKAVGGDFSKLNGAERKMLRDILIHSEANQTWYKDKDFALLWARLSGAGDNLREITDTYISLGKIASASGVDPEFLSQKAFLALKDRSAELGKQIDELVKSGGFSSEAEFWNSVHATGKPIQESAGSGSTLRHPTYDSLINEAKAAGFTEESVNKDLGITRDSFNADREEELLRYVEEPVRPLVRQIWKEGGMPVSSNGFGEGPKGVWYKDANGVEQFKALEGEKASKLMDELTKVNADIAKGPQKVEIDSFLEPHTYQQLRAKDALRQRLDDNETRMQEIFKEIDEAQATGDKQRYYDLMDEYNVRRQDSADILNQHGAQPERVFPKEHEDLWQSLDKAASDAMDKQARAGEQATRSMKRAAKLSEALDARKSTEFLDSFLDQFRGGVMLTEVSGIEDLLSTRVYSFVNRDDLAKLAEESAPLNPKWGADGHVNGIRVLELPGGRFLAWAGHTDFHENVLAQLNAILKERGLPEIPLKDTNNIFIPVDQSRQGPKRFGKVDVQTPLLSEAGHYEWSADHTMSYADFARNAETHAVNGRAFEKRVKDAEGRANRALNGAMSGGEATEDFRNAVDNGLTIKSTKRLVNADGQTIHANRQKVMTRPLEYDPTMEANVSNRVKAAYKKMIEISDVEHLLRNEERYLQKAVRGMQTFSFRTLRGDIMDVDGIIYRAGSLPDVPSSRVYNISDDLHYTAKTDEEVRPGYGLRLTSADIDRMIKKEGYVMVRLEEPQNMKGGVTVQWFIGKANDFEVKPLKFEQVGYIAGGHRGYRDSYFSKQARVGQQGDNNERYLMNPHTHIVGTKAEVEAWNATMESARAIWNSTKDTERRSELLAQLLDGKMGYPSGSEFEQMIKQGQFDPEHQLHTLYDREMPPEYAELKNRGYDNMMEETESGINSFYRTKGQMYTSPKGARLQDWRGQNAAIIDPFEMMNRSLSNIASLSSLGDYKLREIEKWVKTFGKYLDTSALPKEASPVRIFQESLFRTDIPEAMKMKNSAEAQRDTIKGILGWRSDIDREFEYMGRQLVNFVAGKKPGKWNKGATRSMNWVLEKDPVAKARMMAFHMKMGLGNVAQFPMQISTMFAATSIDFVGGMRGMYNIYPMIGYLARTSGEEWLELMTKLGFHTLTGFETAEDYKVMMRAAKSSGRFDIGGSHQLINYDGVEAAQSLIGKVGRVAAKGAFFFNEAERWNQTVAWSIAWKRAGLMGLEPGTAKFNEMVSKLAGDFSFNMSRAGSAAWQRSWASIPTQFLSYQARVLEAFLGKQFTVAEKLRLLIGQGVLYGTAGVPLVPYISEQMRGQAGQAAEIGTWEGLIERGVIDTWIHVATGLDVQYGERAAVGSFVTDTFREIIGMSKYGETSFADVMGGPLYGMTKQIVPALWNTVMYASAESGGDTGLPLTSAAVIELARNVSSINNAYKAYMVWNYGQYITTSGKVALDDLPSADAFAVFLGLAPGEYRDYAAKQDWRRNRGQTISELSEKIIEFRQRMAREPENASAIASSMEIFQKLHPADIWAEAWDRANSSKANESIYDGLARRYEIEQNKARFEHEQNKAREGKN